MTRYQTRLESFQWQIGYLAPLARQGNAKAAHELQTAKRNVDALCPRCGAFCHSISDGGIPADKCEDCATVYVL